MEVTDIKMTRPTIKPRRCHLKECSCIFTPKNDKGAYCSEKHRLKDNKNRRDKRDFLFNAMVAAFKKNYHILFLYKNEAVITAEELKNIGFNFRYIPELDENDVHWFGSHGLKLTDEFNYIIIKKNDAK